MANSPAADSALKFINICSLDLELLKSGTFANSKLFMTVHVYCGINFFLYMITGGSMTFVSGLQLSLTIINFVETPGLGLILLR